MKARNHTVLSGGYVDNYSNSFRALKEFRRVIADMEKIHTDIGLPLKATYANIGTDAEILKKLGKENQVSQTYAFLCIAWNLLIN